MYSHRIFLIVSFYFLSLFGFAQTKVHSIFQYEKTIYVGTNYGVYQTQLESLEWKLTNTGLPDYVEIILFSFSNEALFSSTENELFKSNDLGKTWFKVVELPSQIKNIVSLFSNDTALFVVDLNVGITYTPDGGKNWSILPLTEWLNPIETNEDDKKKNKKEKKEITENSKTVHDLVECQDKLFAGVSSKVKGGGVYQSINSGKNWIEASFDIQNQNIYRFYPYGKYIYAVTSGINCSLFCTLNYGVNWVKLSKPPIRWITSFAVSEKYLFAANNKDGLYYSDDYGRNWEKINISTLQSNQTIDCLTPIGNDIMIGTSDGILYLSFLNGKWIVEHEGLKTKKIGAFSYLPVGTKNEVSLNANKNSNEIIFEVQNKSAQTAKVLITVTLECEYPSSMGMMTLPETNIDWLITVEPNSQKSYDLFPRECSVSTCNNNTKNWNISKWDVQFE